MFRPEPDGTAGPADEISAACPACRGRCLVCDGVWLYGTHWHCLDCGARWTLWAGKTRAA